MLYTVPKKSKNYKSYLKKLTKKPNMKYTEMMQLIYRTNY